jgi:hypothetical protein
MHGKLDYKFAQIYKVHPTKAVQILSDIYFLVDFWGQYEIKQRGRYNRTAEYLKAKYGVFIPSTTVRRWYLNIKKCNLES